MVDAGRISWLRVPLWPFDGFQARLFGRRLRESDVCGFKLDRRVLEVSGSSVSESKSRQESSPSSADREERAFMEMTALAGCEELLKECIFTRIKIAESMRGRNCKTRRRLQARCTRSTRGTRLDQARSNRDGGRGRS